MPPQSASTADVKRGFRGWWMVVATLITFGLSVGVPYYNTVFFYDYFQHTFGWELKSITLAFPVAALLTLWIGPLVIPRVSPRKLIVIGTGLTAVAFFGFAFMTGSLPVYFVLYFVYTVGYIFSGPIPHQILISQWFKKRRGRAMGIVYVGVGLFGGLGSFFVRSVTHRFGFQTALMAVGALLFLAWPLALGVLKDKPSDVGQFPDGFDYVPPDVKQASHSFMYLLRTPAFWLLMLGSICSIGSIGSINMHMKFVFRDAGYSNQRLLDDTWTTASALILWSSIVGRLSIGYLADVFSKKRVMTATYFIVAATILLLLTVAPDRPESLYIFSVVFGFSMGADYMLIPLMAAEQFGINTLSRAMAVILPVNTIGQTWCPYLVSALREHYGNYVAPLLVVFAISMVGALAIAVMPSRVHVAEPQPESERENARAA